MNTGSPVWFSEDEKRLPEDEKVLLGGANVEFNGGPGYGGGGSLISTRLVPWWLLLPVPVAACALGLSEVEFLVALSV